MFSGSFECLASAPRLLFSRKFNQMAAIRDVTPPWFSKTHPLRNTNHLNPFNSQFRPTQITYLPRKPLVITAKARKPANTRTESAKVLERRIRKKFDGTAKKPRLSVFCSDKQLYAMLVDDQNKKCLFYASTIHKGIRADPKITTTQEAARVVGEQVVKAAADLNIHEISSYDLNGSAVRGLRGQRIRAFESAISTHGFLP